MSDTAASYFFLNLISTFSSSSALSSSLHCFDQLASLVQATISLRSWLVEILSSVLYILIYVTQIHTVLHMNLIILVRSYFIGLFNCYRRLVSRCDNFSQTVA
jgi:hypothetical protein